MLHLAVTNVLQLYLLCKAHQHRLTVSNCPCQNSYLLPIWTHCQCNNCPSSLLLAAFCRVAIVMISGPQSAKAAVTELNGCCMEGHTLHVEHIAGSHSQASASISGPESSQNATKPQTPKTESSSTERKVRIWEGNVEKKITVCSVKLGLLTVFTVWETKLEL